MARTDRFPATASPVHLINDDARRLAARQSTPSREGPGLERVADALVHDPAGAVVGRVHLEDLVARLPREDVRQRRLAQSRRATQKQDLWQGRNRGSAILTKHLMRQ